MPRVLVTGASGFVGTRVCRKLLDCGWSVRAAVRSPAGAARLPAGAEVQVIGSVESFHQWDSALANVDMVVHLIARTHTKSIRGDNSFDKYHSTNVQGTRSLLDSCKRSSVRRFVFMSSIKAVGEGAAHSYRESDPCNPQDDYGITKRMAEELVLQRAESSRFEPVVLRPPLVYGPGVRGNLLRVLRAVDRGLPLPLGAVSNARSLIYVDNLADAITACLTHPAAAGELFHVADTISVSTTRLVQTIASHAGRKPRLLPIPVAAIKLVASMAGKTSEIRRLTESLTLTTDKIERQLQWKPSISFDEGIRLTVAHFMEQRKSATALKRAA